MTPVTEHNPFIGLRSYESNESILFFGRHEQTLELLQRLHLFHFLAVIGSSGSGKSSLVKAGLIPQLKAGYLVNEQSKWQIAIMKPGQNPLQNFGDTIYNQFSLNNSIDAQSFRQKIEEQGIEAVVDLISSSANNQTNFLLLVDQFEELFRFSFHEKQITIKDKSADFVNMLLDISSQKNINFYVAITMRSDFIGDCAQFYGLPEAINKGLYLIPRLTRTQLEIIVEGPVRLFNKNINPALTHRVLNDLQLMEDALPLLQHVLMRTWNYEMEVDKNGELDIKDYENVGGITRALSIHADEALQGMNENELQLTKKIFQALTAVDKNGRKIRRPAHLSELVEVTGVSREAVLNIINRFIEGNKSFLITSKVEDKNDLLIDISHESLIRQWDLLNEWVDREADAAKIFLRLLEAKRLYKEKNKNFLTGNELNQFWQWYLSFNPGAEWAKRYSEEYNDCINYLKQSKEAEQKQHAIKKRNRRILITAVALVFVIISLFSIKVYRDYIKSVNALALNYFTNSQTQANSNNALDALHLIAEAAATGTHNNFIKNMLINGEGLLPVACLKNMYAVNGSINTVAFSPDEKWIIAATANGSFYVIDKQSGNKIMAVEDKGYPFSSAVFSNDGNFILTAGNDNTATIWSIAQKKPVNVFNHNEDVTSAAFSNDGRLIATTCADSCTRIWNVATHAVIDSFKQQAVATGIVFSKDDKFVLTSANDSAARLWNVATAMPVYIFLHNNANVKTAVFSADEKQILTTGSDSMARIWNAETGAITDSLKFEAEVTCGAFSPDNKWIAIATRAKYIHIINTSTGAIDGPALKSDAPVYSIDFSKDGKWLISGGGDEIIRLWNIEPALNNIINTYESNSIVNSAVFSKDGKWILTGGYDSVARLWNAETNKLERTFDQRNVINSTAFSNDGNLILTSGKDSTAKLWDVATGKLQHVFKHNGEVKSAVFNADKKTILTTGDDSTVCLWNMNGQKLNAFHFEDKVRSGVLSNDGQTILITGSANKAYLVNAKTGNEIKSFEQDNAIKTAVFSTNGQWILTAGWDSTARIWNTLTGRQNGPSMKYNSYISTAAFSPDSKLVIIAGYGPAASIWDVTTRKQIFNSPLDATATSAAFSTDQQYILIATRAGKTYRIKIPGDLDIPPALFRLQAQAATGVKYDNETSETRCLLPEEWKLLNSKYETEASHHYNNCEYQYYNFWKRFNTGATN